MNLFLRLLIVFSVTEFINPPVFAQLKWINVDSLFQPIPHSIHVYKSTSTLDGKPNVAYFVEADLKDKKIIFTTDTTNKRRLTPLQYFEKNAKPILVVNCTFFSFETNQNLNVIIRDGKMLSYNARYVKGKGLDSTEIYMPVLSAIGINKRRHADIAWVYSDSSIQLPVVYAYPVEPMPQYIAPWFYPWNRFSYRLDSIIKRPDSNHDIFRKKYWKMNTAVGGGPVLLQRGKIFITNEEERMFAGKAIDDKHPRTAMGYTSNRKLIILVIEGRHPGIAEGATLLQEAQIFKTLGCVEALNLDGGGSSCLLINGKETIMPSDKEGERAVPAVFLIKKRK
jgi:hypothetical protein